MQTITPELAIKLGYTDITEPMAPYEANYATRIAADLERDHIPHAIVRLADAQLQVWRKLGAQASTEHHRPPASTQPRRSRSASSAFSAVHPPSVSSASSVVNPSQEPLSQSLRLASTEHRRPNPY